MTRIEKRFAALTEARRKAFVAFVMAGDPDPETALASAEAGGSGDDLYDKAVHVVLTDKKVST